MKSLQTGKKHSGGIKDADMITDLDVSLIRHECMREHQKR